ncbi:hypothetical protein GJ631_01650 [Natronomonas sp. CBA1123]|uniref:hypothetical protein n=1 Tax=Natronomonas sp. CBA1123 TaxID=2668070 RepID=UPI0012EAED39|nr:hypothetical protein [Natronomonas sp. CBA1123]MUV85321.1 hypothetical protein [Natronomonas sp. CBA1123]
MIDNYDYSSSKPETDLVNYNTVRVPELRLIYRTLDSVGGHANVSTLRDTMTPEDDDHLDECLRYLRAVDLVDRNEDRVVELANEEVFPNLSFEPRLLLHLNQQDHPQDHVTEAQRVAFAKAPKTLRRDQLEVELEGELDYIAWNETKLNAWYRLLQGIGVLSFIDSRELVLSPRPRLLYELFETFRDTENSTDFGEAVAWIEKHFMSVLTTRPGTPRLHKGVTDTLQTLLDEEYVSVRGMSDATSEVVLPLTHSRNEEPAVTEFELHGWPTNPPASKRYPLDQFTEAHT